MHVELRRQPQVRLLDDHVVAQRAQRLAHQPPPIGVGGVVNAEVRQNVFGKPVIQIGVQAAQLGLVATLEIGGLEGFVQRPTALEKIDFAVPLAVVTRAVLLDLQQMQAQLLVGQFRQLAERLDRQQPRSGAGTVVVDRLSAERHPRVPDQLDHVLDRDRFRRDPPTFAPPLERLVHFGGSGQHKADAELRGQFLKHFVGFEDQIQLFGVRTDENRVGVDDQVDALHERLVAFLARQASQSLRFPLSIHQIEERFVLLVMGRTSRQQCIAPRKNRGHARLEDPVAALAVGTRPHDVQTHLERLSVHDNWLHRASRRGVAATALHSGRFQVTRRRTRKQGKISRNHRSLAQSANALARVPGPNSPNARPLV
jgi:hypothetical protein